MCSSPEPVRTDKTLVVYKLDRLSDLSDAFLDKLAWPQGATQLAFRFKEAAVDAAQLLGERVSRRYVARIGYLAASDAVAIPVCEGATGVELLTPDNLEALRDLTKRTIIQFFYEPWRDYVSPDFPGEVDAFVTGPLSREDSAWLVSGKECVGLLNLMRHKDCLGRPIDHVAWVWLDKRLTSAARKEARRLLALRLSRCAGPIQAYVHPFNVRSAVFFEKLGFKPACVHITRHT
jgi:RimJ/RimL family protein N-acetyltransferase